MKIEIHGRISSDPELSNTNGRNVFTFNVVHTETFRNSIGIEIEKDIVVECLVWDDILDEDLIKRLFKGDKVEIEGFPKVSHCYCDYDDNEGSRILQCVVSILRIVSIPRPIVEHGMFDDLP